MVVFKILRQSKRVHSKLATLDFRRADFELFRELLGRVTWDKALEGRGAQESWSVFKDHLLQAQKQCIPRNKRQAKMPGGLCGSTRSSWTYLSSKRKSIGSVRRSWRPGYKG